MVDGPLICNACGKVYLHGDADGLCDDPRCNGAMLDHLIGFVSYRRVCQTHKGVEPNDLALRIKDRVEKILFARRIGGGLFIDKTGIEREDFEHKISKTIAACRKRVFLLILTPGALDPRQNEDEDWLVKEIRLAIEHDLEIIPVMASKYRQDADFQWPENLPKEIASIQKKNVNLNFIGDLDERYLVDATQHIASEVIRHVESDFPHVISQRAPALPSQSGGTKSAKGALDLDAWRTVAARKMVCIPSGVFPMGSEAGPASESPIHEVEVSSFYMTKCLITHKEYERLMGSNPSNFVGDPNRPVESVSWFDAVKFCNAWSAADGLEPVYDLSGDDVLADFTKNGYRLPTEAEWEYACRANSTSEYFWGDDEKLASAYCWFDSNSEDTTHSVGTKKRNGFGLYDMCGNVWEWTQDWFSPSYYDDSERLNPLGPEFGEHKVLRGGCWFNGVSRLRCGSRLKRLPVLVDDVTGFRCVARHPDLR